MKGRAVLVALVGQLAFLSSPAHAEVPQGVHIKIDEARMRAHVVLPPNVVGAESDHGAEGIVVKGPPLPQPGFQASFDLHGFGEDLRDQLDKEVAGYALEVRQSGKSVYSHTSGWAQTKADGAEGWTLDRRQHVASLSKMITADAMTKVLDDKKISYDATISGYLPAYWTLGPNVDKITFRELLTHTSGFNSGGSSASNYTFMKGMVAAGVTSRGTYHYENMNFGICRILLAVITGAIDRTTSFPVSNDPMWDFVTTTAYEVYAGVNVFAPAGVSDYSLDHPTHGALAYNFPTSGSGWNSGDLTSMAGAAGWHLTVDDVLNVMGTVRRSGTILPPDKAQGMLDGKFGIDAVHTTALGKLYCKNGKWNRTSSAQGHQEEQGVACYLPQDMELAVLANSPITATNEGLMGMVINTYVKYVVLKRVGL